jgi:hypothetical protein
MRALLPLLPSLLLLCGFLPAPFDAEAVPHASAARKEAIAACGARKDFKSSAEVIDCLAMADSAFAHAIRLGNAKMLDDYLAGMKALEGRIVAGSIKPDEIAASFHGLQDGFFKALNDQFGDYQASLAQDMASGQPRSPSGMTGNMDTMSNMGGMDGMRGMGN